MLALLVATSAFSELNEAHRAFVAAPEPGKAAAQALLGQLYARAGMQASAKFFFERALKAEPHTEEAKTGLAALAAVPPPQAEAQLGSLAQLDLLAQLDTRCCSAAYGRRSTRWRNLSQRSWRLGMLVF